MPFKDPSLCTIYATLIPGTKHAVVEDIIMRTVHAVAERGVTNDELTRVLAGVRTALALSRDGQFAILSSLNEAIAIGDWKYYFDLPDLLARVTPASVQRTVAARFTPTTATVGYYYGTTA